jgi:hypothetical protein
MLNIENKTRAAAPRCFGLLGFVVFVLALSFGSLVSNAARQENAGKTPCRITRINAKTGVVSASVIEGSPVGGVQSFQFFVKDPALRRSLTEGQEILADFDAQEVFTSAGASGQGVRLGGILTDYYGKNLGGPAGGSGTGGAGQSHAGTQSGPTSQLGGRTGGGNMGGGIGGGQSQAGSPCGPPSNVGGIDMGGGSISGGVQSQAASPLGPPPQPSGGMGGGNMGGGIGIGGGVQSPAGSPCGPPPQSGGVGNPLGGQNLGNGANPSFGNAGGVGDTVAGQNLGNAANPGQPNCQITNIDAATGLVRAKNLSTGQEFQFRVKDPAQLRSLNVGQSFFANLDSRQVSFDGKSFSGIQSFSFFNAGAQN